MTTNRIRKPMLFLALGLAAGLTGCRSAQTGSASQAQPAYSGLASMGAGDGLGATFYESKQILARKNAKNPDTFASTYSPFQLPSD